MTQKTKTGAWRQFAQNDRREVQEFAKSYFALIGSLYPREPGEGLEDYCARVSKLPNLDTDVSHQLGCLHRLFAGVGASVDELLGACEDETASRRPATGSQAQDEEANVASCSRNCPSQLEIRLQAYALLCFASMSVWKRGYGDEQFWPGRVERPDGTQVWITEEAVDLARTLIENGEEELSRAIEQELALPHYIPPVFFDLLPEVSRNEPQPKVWRR